MLNAQNVRFWHEYTPKTFLPLIHCVIDEFLSKAKPDFRQTLLQFIDVMNLSSVANVSVHAKGHFSI